MHGYGVSAFPVQAFCLMSAWLRISGIPFELFIFKCVLCCLTALVR